jgi:triacylglycerol lipase
MLSRRLAAFAATVALCVGVAAPATASAQDPILFVHGWSESSSLWSTMIKNFENDGYPKSFLSAYSYSSNTSNKTLAENEVKSHVEALKKATGATKVDIISHSMGSLNTRWYIKFVSGGEANVDDWVSLGGPNHGTNTAKLCFSVACEEMRVGSKFLAELNATDETPGAVNYGTWWSPCDEIINPVESVILSGATNTKTACMSHTALTTDKTVYEQVREFVK